MNERRTRTLLVSIAAATVVMSSLIGAQPASPLAGTWTLDRDVSPAANARGRNARTQFQGISIPLKLIITPEPTSVTIESDTGPAASMVTSVYKLDGGEHPIPGPLAWDTYGKAAWQGDKLQIIVIRKIQTPNEEFRFEIQEIYSVSGNVLTLDLTQNTMNARLVYRR
jgi:hypothetical protein